MPLNFQGALRFLRRDLAQNDRLLKHHTADRTEPRGRMYAVAARKANRVTVHNQPPRFDCTTQGKWSGGNQGTEGHHPVRPDQEKTATHQQV